jgi:hypothetical protein
LELNRKDPAAALKTLQPAVPPLEFGVVTFGANASGSCLYPTYLRGEAYLAAGQGVAAAAEFQKILEHNGIVWNCWTGALAQLGFARASALQIGTARGAEADAARGRALTAYRRFLVERRRLQHSHLQGSDSRIRYTAIVPQVGPEIPQQAGNMKQRIAASDRSSGNFSQLSGNIDVR